MSQSLKPIRYEWETIPWRKLEVKVFKLQKRIYQASLRGNVRLVHRLQRLLVKSWSGRVLAVRKVSQDNQGKNGTKKSSKLCGIKNTAFNARDGSNGMNQSRINKAMS
jgi:RNA-directed DNA polymerase